MYPIKSFCCIILVLSIASCDSYNPANKEAAASATTNYLASADSISFASDPSDINSFSRKMVRTADFQCRVEDVFAATTALENLVNSKGGMVQESQLENELSTTKLLPYQNDSLKQVQTYQTKSTMILRVPYTQLDTILVAIPQYASFVYHRNLKQEDMTLQYLSNALKNKSNREARTNQPVLKARKTEEAIDADRYMDNKEDQQIERRLTNLGLLDMANYATVTICFTQPELLDVRIVKDNQAALEPSFMQRVAEALAMGWTFITELLLALMRIWPLVIAIAAGWLLYRKSLLKKLAAINRQH